MEAWNWNVALLHLLCAPLYLLVSIARHELAHALVATLSGFRVTKIEIVPGYFGPRFYWGYFEMTPRSEAAKLNPHIYLAPYYVNALSVLAWFLWNYFAMPVSFHLWLFAFIMLLMSPLIDTAANFQLWLRKDEGDFAKTFGANK